MLQKLDHHRVSLFGIEIDALDMQQAVDVLLTTIAARPENCHYVVTPNVDHVVMLQDHAAFQLAYRDANLVLADGWPVVSASRWLRRPLPERVPGSDLVPALFEQATPERPLTTFLLGAAPGVGERAAERIEDQWPNIQVVGTYSPPLGFQTDPRENQEILARIAVCRPDILVVGLGAPKQEMWVHRHQREIDASVALCVGATIDFLAGEKKRAPRWIQRMKLEWLHRMLSEPKRLLKRYLRGAFVFPYLVARETRSRSTIGPQS